MLTMIYSNSHRKGTSKASGKDYDFYAIQYLYKYDYNGVKSFATQDKIINAEQSAKIGKNLPCVVDIEYDARGYIVNITPKDIDISAFLKRA